MSTKKKVVLAIIVLVPLGIGAYFVMKYVNKSSDNKLAAAKDNLRQYGALV